MLALVLSLCLLWTPPQVCQRVLPVRTFLSAANPRSAPQNQPIARRLEGAWPLPLCVCRYSGAYCNCNAVNTRTSRQKNVAWTLRNVSPYPSIKLIYCSRWALLYYHIIYYFYFEHLGAVILSHRRGKSFFLNRDPLSASALTPWRHLVVPCRLQRSHKNFFFFFKHHTILPLIGVLGADLRLKFPFHL